MSNLREAIAKAAIAGDVPALAEFVAAEGAAAARLDAEPNELTALHLAAAAGQLDAVRYLLSPAVGADARAARINNFTPLHAAAMHGHTTVCDALLRACAAVNVQTRPQGYAPLHSAAFAGHVETIRLLLSHGADPTLVNYRKERPAETAERQRQAEAIKILREAMHNHSRPQQKTAGITRIVGRLFSRGGATSPDKLADPTKVSRNMREPPSVWQSNTETLDDGLSGQKTTLSTEGVPLTYSRVLELWRTDESFRIFFISILASAPYSAFRWETPPVTAHTINRPFEFVLLDAPALIRAPEPQAFASHYRTGDIATVVAFTNLGGDATMIVPKPLAASPAYVHLAAFVRDAPDAQRHEFWQTVGETIASQIGNKPLWLSTAGMGVAWLHARVDSRPKYYGYSPYTE